MRVRHYAGLVGLGCLVLAGCAAQPAAVTPAEAVAQLRTGRPLLTCREACLVAWQRAEPQAVQLAVGARWADLAALALRIGYQDDLSLYYLGRAAEGLGYPRAAASYYRQSSALSGTSISCRNLSRMCGGMIFPRAALLRLAALERNLKRFQASADRAGATRTRDAGIGPRGSRGTGAQPGIKPRRAGAFGIYRAPSRHALSRRGVRLGIRPMPRDRKAGAR